MCKVFMKKEAFISNELQYFFTHRSRNDGMNISWCKPHMKSMATWRTSWQRYSESWKTGCCGTIWSWNLTPTTWNKCEIWHVSRGLLIAVFGWIRSSVFWDFRDNRAAAAVFWVSKVEVQQRKRREDWDWQHPSRLSRLCVLLVKSENNNEKDEKDAMAQRTKVSVCISLEFSVVQSCG